VSRYRKVLTRIWTDERFRPFLSETQRLFLYHLTSPQSTPFLLYVETREQITTTLRLSRPAFRKASGPLLEADMVRYADDGSSLVFLPKAMLIEENAPTGPTSITSWVNLFRDLPALVFRAESLEHWRSLRTEHVLHPNISAFIDVLVKVHGKAFGKAFDKPPDKGFGSQSENSQPKALSGAVAVSDTGTGAVSGKGSPPVDECGQLGGGRPAARQLESSLSRTATTGRGARPISDVVAQLRAKEGKE